MSVKGFKVFNPDWTCRNNFVYEVGKTYKHDGAIELCKEGFHFCQKAADCFNYYSFDSENKVAEVEAVGNVINGDDKSVTDEIVILRELSWHEVLDLVNSGKGNSGNWNSGNYNSGNYNSGNWNSGDWNSGHKNSGNYNSGNYNSGNYNSGNWNSGNCNSGNWNSGNWNSGNWNSTNFSTGFFNTVEQPLYAFNKPLKIKREAFLTNRAIIAMRGKFDYGQIQEIKVADFKTACANMWDRMTQQEKELVKDIPNFDAEVFEEITGIKVNKEE